MPGNCDTISSGDSPCPSCHTTISCTRRRLPAIRGFSPHIPGVRTMCSTRDKAMCVSSDEGCGSIALLYRSMPLRLHSDGHNDAVEGHVRPVLSFDAIFFFLLFHSCSPLFPHTIPLCVRFPLEEYVRSRIQLQAARCLWCASPQMGGDVLPLCTAQ